MFVNSTARKNLGLAMCRMLARNYGARTLQLLHCPCLGRKPARRRSLLLEQHSYFHNASYFGARASTQLFPRNVGGSRLSHSDQSGDDFLAQDNRESNDGEHPEASLDDTIGEDFDDDEHLPVTTKDARSILSKSCRNRNIPLNKKLTYKPWRLALMIHRHDLHVAFSKKKRDSIQLDSDLRKHIKPKQNERSSWIHAHVSDTIANRFSRKNQAWATGEILRQKLIGFCEEAMHVAKERGICKNLEEELGTWDPDEPGIFLNRFARVMAHAESLRSVPWRPPSTNSSKKNAKQRYKENTKKRQDTGKKDKYKQSEKSTKGRNAEPFQSANRKHKNNVRTKRVQSG